MPLHNALHRKQLRVTWKAKSKRIVEANLAYLHSENTFTSPIVTGLPFLLAFIWPISVFSTSILSFNIFFWTKTTNARSVLTFYYKMLKSPSDHFVSFQYRIRKKAISESINCICVSSVIYVILNPWPTGPYSEVKISFMQKHLLFCKCLEKIQMSNVSIQLNCKWRKHLRKC